MHSSTNCKASSFNNSKVTFVLINSSLVPFAGEMGSKLATSEDLSYYKDILHYLRSTVGRGQKLEAIQRASGHFWWAYNGNSTSKWTARLRKTRAEDLACWRWSCIARCSAGLHMAQPNPGVHCLVVKAWVCLAFGIAGLAF